MKKNIVFIGAYLVVGALFSLSSCNSTGSKSHDSVEDFYEVTNQQNVVCPNCNGYGMYGGYTCIVCNGTGQVQLEEVETRSYGDISFRGRSYIYGPCNSGCGCQKYVHAPGQTQCVNCAYYNCTSNKFSHRKIYK